MKKIFVVLSLFASVAMQAKNLKADVDLSHDLWWNAPEVPTVRFTVSDTLGVSNESVVKFFVTSDLDPGRRLFAVSEQLKLPKGYKQELDYELDVKMPGFYRCTITDDDNVIKEFTFGYEPTSVLSLPDSKDDFNTFWQKALDELATVPLDATITENAEKSGKTRTAYDVTFRSLGAETIKALLFIPKAPGKYPAQIFYNGYGGKPWDMDPDSRPGWIELMTSVRGQFFSEDDNTYGDWIRYRLDDPAEYYYRGAFMDAVRAIDFIEQLLQTDTARIYAEGGSQGGALTLAAAALGGGRLRAIAPYIPFLNDFRDYFRIVDWPASAVREAARDQGLSDEQMYENLTYFDVKNLARRITCPVLMGIGLQDQVCPPHTNMASYNLITSPKELVIYPTCGHTVDYDDWNVRRDRFFDKW